MDVLKVQLKPIVEKAWVLNNKFIEEWFNESCKGNFWRKYDVMHIPDFNVIKSFTIEEGKEKTEYFFSLAYPLQSLIMPIGSYLIKHKNKFSLISEKDFNENYVILGE